MSETTIHEIESDAGTVLDEDLDTSDDVVVENVETQKKQFQKAAVQVSISEYMYKNIHLLGFENTSRVINVAIRELVDNTLDAANQAGLLPQIRCKITKLKQKKYKLIFQDFGPGIDPKAAPSVCGRLLYGNKFIDSKPQRGCQGMGLTALILYSQKTTGKPTRLILKTKDCKNPTEIVLKIDIKKNRPDVVSTRKLKEDNQYFKPDQTGFFIEIDLLAQYIRKGEKSTTELLRQYSYLNSNLDLTYEGPDSELRCERMSTDPTVSPVKTKNIPHHAPIGNFINFFTNNRSTLIDFLTAQFEGSESDYVKCLNNAYIPKYVRCSALNVRSIENLMEQFKTQFKNLRPRDECLVDLGPSIIKTITQNYTRAFDNVISVSSKPTYYENGCLKVEISAFYGGPTLAADQKIQIYRVANGTPLLYQSSACAITKTLISFDWKKIGLSHVQNELPRGKMIIFVNINAVKVPYITESKDAIASTQIINTLIMECLELLTKKLSTYMKREQIFKSIQQKSKIITRIFPDLLNVLQTTLDAGSKEPFLDRQKTQIIKSKILQMVCLVKDKEADEIRVYNYSGQSKTFLIGVTKPPYTEIDVETATELTLKHGQFRTIKYVDNVKIKGLLPVQFIII